MQLAPTTRPIYARHIANPEFEMRVTRMAEKRLPMGGIPAVLTDDQGGWYSAELIRDDDRDDDDEFPWVALAVNGYADELTARTEAERRA